MRLSGRINSYIIELIEVICLKQLVARIRENIHLYVAILVLILAFGFGVGIVSATSLEDGIDETRVGSVFLGQYESGQYAVVLDREIDLWQGRMEYCLTYQEYGIKVDPELFVFDMSSTISGIVPAKKNQAVFTLESEARNAFIAEIVALFPDEIDAGIDFDHLFADLLDCAGNLVAKREFELEDYLDPGLASIVIASTFINDLPGSDVDAILEAAPEFVIRPQMRFSLLETLGSTPLNNNQLSIIASGLLELTLKTSFSGYLFSGFFEAPDWEAPGMRVMILKVNNYDFSFFNELDQSYTVDLTESAGGTLVFTLKGYPLVAEYSTTLTTVSTIEHDTVYQVNETIDQDTPGVIITETDTEYTYRVLVQPGVDGSVDAWIRIVTSPNEDPVSTILFYRQIRPIEAIYEENVVLKAGE